MAHKKSPHKKEMSKQKKEMPMHEMKDKVKTAKHKN